ELDCAAAVTESSALASIKVARAVPHIAARRLGARLRFARRSCIISLLSPCAARPSLGTSSNRAHDSAIDAQRGSGRGGRQRRADVGHHVRHLLYRRKTPDQRARTALDDEFPLHLRFRHALLLSELGEEFHNAV